MDEKREAVADILNTLVSADNESTESPYWLIIDPKSIHGFASQQTISTIAGCITGPFFSRADAEQHLKGRSYAFSKKARVWCHSGCDSYKYKRVCRSLEIGMIKREPSQRIKDVIGEE